MRMKKRGTGWSFWRDGRGRPVYLDRCAIFLQLLLFCSQDGYYGLIFNYILPDFSSLDFGSCFSMAVKEGIVIGKNHAPGIWNPCRKGDLLRSGPPRKGLYSRNLGISGKPDYIVKGRGRSLIPVEIKSGRLMSPIETTSCNWRHTATWWKRTTTGQCLMG